MEYLLLKVLLQLALIVVTARILAALFKKMGQPGVCGEIAAGLILGPSLFGRLFPQTFQQVFDPSVSQIIAIFSQIGLVLLLFLVGMEFEFSHLRSHGRKAVLISLAGIILPFGGGFLLAKAIHPLVAREIPFLGFALFTATAMSITALPTLGRILIELGLNRTQLGVIAITAAALEDAVGWIIVASINAIVRSNFQPMLAIKMILEVLAFAAFLLLVVRPVVKKWIRHVLRVEGEQISLATLTILFSLMFGAAMVTNLIGIFSIFGAFLMGAVLFDEAEFRKAVALRLSDFVYVFFVPIFFMYTGLRTDVGLISSPLALKLCLAVLGVAIVAKGGGCALAARLGGLSGRDALAMGALMNTRGLMELIVLNVGYDLGVIPRTMFTVLTIMAVITTYMTVPLVRRLLRQEVPALSAQRSAHGPPGSSTFIPRAS